MQGELFEAGGGYVSQASRVKKSATYEEFVEKFKPKKRRMTVTRPPMCTRL